MEQDPCRADPPLPHGGQANLVELTLSVQRWTCPECRARHDRDLNAAKNILAAGRAVAQDDSGEACGADVRRRGLALPQLALKQESRVARHTS
ncbi:zinc ribbon domain-containing protein [Lentzea sp. E54]|uniref:zinc ribbon domain-containing protein n=1 Tax=Lentzea xerophila TaxID=3435883 RepID=UPI003DA37313